jgi:hypothetical protein
VTGLPPTIGIVELVQGILDAVLAFVGDAEPHDDITLIAVRPLARGPAPYGDDLAALAPTATEVGR